MYDLVVRDGMIITASGPLFADIALENGKIAALGKKLKGRQELNAHGLMVLPGVVDAHVHLDLPVRGTAPATTFYPGPVRPWLEGLPQWWTSQSGAVTPPWWRT